MEPVAADIRDIPAVAAGRRMPQGGLRISRRFTTPGSDPLAQVKYERRTSRITNTDGSVVFEMEGVEVPESWSQVATDIVASKYFRKSGLPTEASAKAGGEWSVRQVVSRLAGCWRHWGERYGYFDTVQDAQAFEDELKYMLVHQMAAPNSPQWFNTGLHFAYGITGPAQGHYHCDPATGDVMESADAYTRPQPHACFIQSVADDMVAPGGIMDLWTREARLFKYGSGTGTNFSEIRGEGEPLSGGGQSSGLMSFLKIGDRAAGAIKSGGTTRRAAKMVCLDLDHPDIEAFISWKMKEEEKVVAMRRAGYSADFNGEAYQTVSGQNSNNSVRIPHEFFQALDRDGDWELVFRTERRAAAMEHRKAGPCRVLKARDLWEKIATAAWRSADPGVQYDTTINDWHTCPEDGPIRASNPCSEYMFLDNTACNLASLNLLKFYPSTRPPSVGSLRASPSTRVYPERAEGLRASPSTRVYPERAEGLRAGHSTRIADGDARSGQVLSSFDIEGFRHAVHLWTIVLEISVLMAQFPSREIARRSYDFRTLGLGYANLGALLMRMGIPYDSEGARNIAAAITAILTGESYVQSAKMAEVLGPFPGYARNRSHMLRVMRNHRRAAEDAPPHEYEKLHVIPVGIDRRLCPPDLLEAAHGAWDAAVELGERHGYRNAQTTCLAPTGTIGLLMDCDTTGVEPDFALVKFKKLAGGGYMKIANRSVEPALKALGYTEEQVGEIMAFVLGTMTLSGAPHINRESLREKGFTDEDIVSVERRIPQVFDLPCAFSRWTLGAETMERLGFTPEQHAGADFNMLRALGFTTKEIREANEAICGRMTIEGAPYIREEHLKVFDCANRCGTTGRRFIRPEGHIRMLAAVQPFISGSISKTINLPNESAIGDVKQCYLLGWKLGLKANAIYRDGCKLSQPLSTRSDAGETPHQSSSPGSESGAGQAKETGEDVSRGFQPADAGERIRERVIVKEVPRRRKLPDERRSITHKFSVAGHEGYVTVGLYEDGKPGEIFIKMAKEGSTLSGVMDTLALSLSMNLQYGVPLDVLVHKLVHTRFEPAGRTGNREIPMVKSMMDYLGRWLALKFLPKEKAKEVHAAELVEWAYAEGSKSKEMFALSLPVVDEGTGTGTPLRPASQGFEGQAGTGTGIRSSEFMFDRANNEPPSAVDASTMSATIEPLAGMPLAFEVAPDSPMCHQCGSTMIRNGACYKCLDCGETEGCS